MPDDEERDSASTTAVFDASTPTPADSIPPLSDQELESLAQVGRHWRATLESGLDRLNALPVDPSLRRVTQGGRRRRFSRFASVELFEAEGRDELEATPAALGLTSIIPHATARCSTAGACVASKW